MSNTKKTPAARKSTRVEENGIVYRITDDSMSIDFPGGGKAEMSLALDLAGMLDLIDVAQRAGQLDTAGTDPAELLPTLDLIRQLIPAEYMEQTRGVDAGMALRAFMKYAEQLGERLGKAFT